MALRECPNCHAQVSDRATTCPKCGYDLQNDKSIPDNNSSQSSKGKRTGLWVTLAVLIIAIVGGGSYWWYADKQAKEAQESAKEKANAAALAEKQRLAEEAEGARQDSIWNNFITPDLALFNVKGHVKEIKTNSNVQPFLFLPFDIAIKFDKNGKCINLESIMNSWGDTKAVITRNHDGFVTRIDMPMPAVSGYLEFKWSGNEIKAVTYWYFDGATQNYTYKDGVIHSMNEESGGEGGSSSTKVIFTYQFDEHGNWISGTGEGGVFNNEDSEVSSENYNSTFSRQISYYDKSEIQ